MIVKVLGKVKKTICIRKFDDTKTLIDTDDNLPNNITLKNVTILINDVCYKK